MLKYMRHIEGLAQEGCYWVFGFFSREA